MSNNKTNIIEEIRASLNTLGPCYIDPKYLQPGYQYRLVSDEPGRVSSLERLGFTIVRSTDEEDEVNVGEETRSKAHTRGSAVRTYYKSQIPLILMRIPQAQFDAIEKCKQEHNDLLKDSLGVIHGIPQDNTYGEIKTYLK